MLKWLMAPLGLFLCLSSEAFNGFVRPAADCANNGNGQAYGCAASNGATGAWRTMANVVWGVSGVNTGDTLRACSSESSPFTTADYDGGGLAVLSVDQSGVTVDGDCSASGGGSMAYMTGNGTRDYGVYCADTTTCPNQTWRNITVSAADLRGFYVRNNLDTASVVNFTGSNLHTLDIIGGANTIGISGYGDTATLTDVSAIRTTDDAISWLGPNFTVNRWRAIYPAYLGTTDLGDCVQVVTSGDNARILNGYCDKTNLASKQCIIIGDPATGDNAEISGNVCLLSEVDTATFGSKTIYSIVPNTIISRNYVVGGHWGIYVIGAGGIVTGNIVRNIGLRGIDFASTVASGTHLVANNSVSNSPTCVALHGGAAVTINSYNNLVANCSSAGFTKGGSSTLNQSNNRCGQNVTTCNNGGGGSAINDAGWIGGLTPSSAQGFRLNAASLARRAGVDLNTGNVQDHGNRAFAHPPSIGAWEATSGDEAAARTAASTRTAANARTTASTRTAR